MSFFISSEGSDIGEYLNDVEDIHANCEILIKAAGYHGSSVIVLNKTEGDGLFYCFAKD